MNLVQQVSILMFIIQKIKDDKVYLDPTFVK